MRVVYDDHVDDEAWKYVLEFVSTARVKGGEWSERSVKLRLMGKEFANW